ncbi:MAG: hypothetical protein AAF298_12685 [Cyanobacteria bacterium P01_A01_bin.40]
MILEEIEKSKTIIKAILQKRSLKHIEQKKAIALEDHRKIKYYALKIALS